MTVDVPLCLGERCDFVGFSALADITWKNFSSILSLFGLVAGVYFYFRFENEVKGSSLVLKIGTKAVIRRIVEGKDHELDCKVDGVGEMMVTAKFVKKA